jgi:hypothetical protein
MTNPVWTTTSQFLRDIMALDIRFAPEERAVLLAQAVESIEESKRVMLLRMPCSDRIQ